MLKKDRISTHFRLVLSERIELSTSHLPSECSTTELRQQLNLDINISNFADKKALENY